VREGLRGQEGGEANRGGMRRQTQPEPVGGTAEKSSQAQRPARKLGWGGVTRRGEGECAGRKTQVLLVHGQPGRRAVDGVQTFGHLFRFLIDFQFLHHPRLVRC
jgi:hypothetical protein